MIDAFAHLYPTAFVGYIEKMNLPMPVFFQNAPPFVDVNARLQELDCLGIDMQVLALGTPAFDDLFSPDQILPACEAARIANDGIAEVAAEHPDRFIGVATLPLTSLQAVEVALGELDRAINQLRLKAVQLYTPCAGQPMDSPELFPLYEKIVEYDIPILLHPTGGNYGPGTRDYLLWLTFGWPFETSIAMSRLVYSGVLDRFPNLKILTHHLGAFVPYLAARIKGVHFTLERAGGPRLAQPVLNYFKRFYGDTAVNGFIPQLGAGYEFFGADHILFATDSPYVPVEPQRQAVLNWDLPHREKEKILDATARTFFKIVTG
jgi:predicted TIM-barrel fold metal-dependent hydrolase